MPSDDRPGLGHAPNKQSKSSPHVESTALAAVHEHVPKHPARHRKHVAKLAKKYIHTIEKQATHQRAGKPTRAAKLRAVRKELKSVLRAKMEGCCFMIGYGDMMKPCCLKTIPLPKNARCRQQRRMGGATGYANKCPKTAQEAHRILQLHNRPEPKHSPCWDYAMGQCSQHHDICEWNFHAGKCESVRSEKAPPVATHHKGNDQFVPSQNLPRRTLQKTFEYRQLL